MEIYFAAAFISVPLWMIAVELKELKDLNKKK